MSVAIAPETSIRQQEIVNDFKALLDKHMNELRHGEAEKTYEIRDFADALHIHPTHLSNTLHEVLRQSPCDIYELRLIALAKELLLNSTQPIGNIAAQLCYDPSNFTKFFKLYTQQTPKEFRKANLKI
jgi:AraC family transcriptional regulator, regulatory protein of adaptative response / methylphosphotriester-DNA alkyltransferase methyltransferase